MPTTLTHTELRRPLLLAGMGAGLVWLLLFALGVGAVPISFTESIAILSEPLTGRTDVASAQQEMVLYAIRLPRLVLILLVGAALGASGAAMQGLFRNPLVEPSLIGVSSGAALMAVLVIVFSAALPPALAAALGGYLLPLFAFAGGLVATWAAYRIGQVNGRTHITRLILGGVAINALAGALVGLVIFYADDRALRNFTFWSLGDLGGATWPELLTAGPLLLLATLALCQYRSVLNALALGEGEAFHLGVRVERVKALVVLWSALAVGTAVSLCGIIGFVGLVVPHMVRLLLGADHRWVLPGALVAGPLLLLGADLLARTVATPAELPIGVVTALIGAPFFMLLLVKVI